MWHCLFEATFFYPQGSDKYLDFVEKEIMPFVILGIGDFNSVLEIKMYDLNIMVRLFETGRMDKLLQYKKGIM